MNLPLHEKREEVIKRLARIEGHVRGIRRMVEEDKKCPDILLQLAAVRAAINRVGRLVLEDHIEVCVAQAVKEGKGEEAVMELRDALVKFM
ncbi:MAG: metal-sensitive transcriptional regulator [Candidatus Bathyarchaeia archaeon]